MEIQSTKEKIIETSIELFSDKGYDKVSMRDIAAAIGIKAASIYHHFPSKRDILKTIYAVCIREHRQESPSPESLLERLETESVQNLLKNTELFWPAANRERTERVILIASQRISLDRDSWNFINEYFFEPMRSIWEPLLSKAIERGKIETLDINIFSLIASFFAFGAVGFSNSAMKTGREQWEKGLAMILSMLKPASKPG